MEYKRKPCLTIKESVVYRYVCNGIFITIFRQLEIRLLLRYHWFYYVFR